MEILINALRVALLGVVTVFLVLSLIILLIKLQEKLLQYFVNIELQKDMPYTGNETVGASVIKNQILEVNKNEDKHIIVIAAAIAAFLGSGVQIRSIRQIKQERASKGWQLISRTEQNRS